MLRFAIIAEGVTDQAVIDNILTGFFATDGDEPVVNRFHPSPMSLPSGQPAPGGWTLVFRALREGKHREALQHNDFVVIHIDTDVCEEKGYDVARDTTGQESAERLAERVRERLLLEMKCPSDDPSLERIVFAVAVDSVECWLLPLLEDEGARKGKTTGCLAAADRALRSTNRPTLTKGDSKMPTAYDAASREFLKRKTLMAKYALNPSLKAFVEALKALPPEVGT